MKKNKELFYFFSIANAADFKPKLAADILPLITTTTQLLSVSTQPITALNIAFSHTGLLALNVTDPLGDALFNNGQFNDLGLLGDPGSTNWSPNLRARVFTVSSCLHLTRTTTSTRQSPVLNRP
jgi:hypothetical protein